MVHINSKISTTHKDNIQTFLIKLLMMEGVHLKIIIACMTVFFLSCLIPTNSNSLNLLKTAIQNLTLALGPSALVAMLYQHISEEYLVKRFEEFQEENKKAIIYNIENQISGKFIPQLVELHNKSRNAFQDEFFDNTESLLSSKIKIPKGCNFCRNNISNMYIKRDRIDLASFIEQAHECIRIYNTNLSYLTNYVDLLIQKAKKGVKVEILALNPTNSFVIERYSEIQFDKAKHFFADMRGSLIEFLSISQKRLTDQEKRFFTIKTYNKLPTIMIFCSDKMLIIGFILCHDRGRNCTHIEFNSGIDNFFSECFITHFNKTWEEANEITLEEVEKYTFTDIE